MKKGKMKTKRTVMLAVCLIGVVLLASCAQLAQRLAIINCKYAFKDVAPMEFRTTSMDLKLSIQVDNPNAVDVILDRLGFDFFVNDSKVFEGLMEEGLNIPTKSTSVLDHVIKISYLKAGIAVVKAIKEKKAAYKLTGKAYYNTPVGELAFPVEITKGEIK